MTRRAIDSAPILPFRAIRGDWPRFGAARRALAPFGPISHALIVTRWSNAAH